MTPEQLFADVLAARSAQPFVTYYDEATGERSELSAKSLANWVAKTHHLLVDELGLQVGDRASIAVPPHWISVPILLGCLTAGLCLVDGSGAGDAEVAFVDAARAGSVVASGVPDIFVINPASAAMGFGTEAPTGTSDYITAVRPQADAWGSVQMRADENDACIGDRTRGDIVATAAARATALGLHSSARVLVTRDWDGSSDWIDTLLAPLTVGGSIVFVRNSTDDAVVARRMEQERATIRL